MSKCGETSSYGFPVLYSYGQYKCTAVSLGIDKKKKLVKIMKQVKMIKLVIIRLRIIIIIIIIGLFSEVIRNNEGSIR